MSNRFGKEMVEAAKEMAAHMRGEVEAENYEIDPPRKKGKKRLVPCKPTEKPDKA